jgi:hypothetical protein
LPPTLEITHLPDCGFQADISHGKACITRGASELHQGEIEMLRLAFYLGGFGAALAACYVYLDQKRARRRVPAKDAAAMLQKAWADHHTIV